MTFSTALGNHLEPNFLLEVHKPDSASNQVLNPTLRRFLAPSHPANPGPPLSSVAEPGLSESALHPPLPAEVDALAPHTSLGWKFLLDGRPDSALTAYRQALRHQPDSAKAHLGMGMALKTLGDVEEARKAITRALELDPSMAPAMVHLGYLHADPRFGSPDPVAARRLFSQASQLGDLFARIALVDLTTRPHP